MYAEKHSALLDSICWLIFCEIGLHFHINNGKKTSLLLLNMQHVYKH